MNNKPTCPQCGSKKSEQAKQRGRRCTKCGTEYHLSNDGPQYADPVRTLEAKEKAALAAQPRRVMR